ncbi:hypothetical protein ACLM5J_15850 [Nocardioides sp. Bht2]
MSLSTFVLTASEASEPALSPWAVGGIVLAILLSLLVVLIMFGAGREHS